MSEPVDDTYIPPKRTKYRRKPTEIEAVQLCWRNWNDVCDFVGDKIGPDNPAFDVLIGEVSDTCGELGPQYICLRLRTMHGDWAIFRHGDWIIPDKVPGTFYPCKPDVFAATYEPVEDIPRVLTDVKLHSISLEADPQNGTSVQLAEENND